MAVALAVILARARRRLELVARAEHELRGPATVLLLACERMRREPAARRHARALEVELERLRAGLGELTAARGGGRPRASRAEVELGSFARTAADGWRAPLRAAGRDVRVEWRAGPVPLVADRGRLARVLGNLVANAAEHGDGPVELTGSRVEGAVRVEVRNAAAVRPRVGEGRGPASAAGAPVSGGRGHARGGRGLAIARDAARDLGGRLSVEAADGVVTAALELPVADGGGMAAEDGGEAVVEDGRGPTDPPRAA
jgi:signal transduction histidine kinase